MYRDACVIYIHTVYYPFFEIVTHTKELLKSVNIKGTNELAEKMSNLSIDRSIIWGGRNVFGSLEQFNIFSDGWLRDESTIAPPTTMV